MRRREAKRAILKLFDENQYVSCQNIVDAIGAELALVEAICHELKKEDRIMSAGFMARGSAYITSTWGR